MELQTKHFGTVEVDGNELIRFEQGIPGLEQYKTYALLPVDETSVYFALQPVDEAEIALIITNPYLFYQQYSFDLDEAVKEELAISKREDVAVYNVITLKEPFSSSTINLQAPIVINVESKKGRQLILTDDHYHTRHPLIQSQEGGERRAHP
ncbi:flagellar assembly protein FliW [Halobacillus salinarum]|uniref:Flagellar assembly factor FliW n=1 Tax=Halobacillus salinarum TaxID=2932257 RepID=A0ABY4EMP3_9BACI|nr:flagellar assembly protein FliW [Halobacillus salinarum]UOQ45729.1 flagellar assembly protein FliW [Halobacillus salinarum]